MTDRSRHWGVLPRALLGALALVCAGAAGVRAGEPDTASHTFRVDTPPIRVKTAADGFSVVEAPGLESHRSPLGAPDIPIRSVLVAIPEGAEPRLEVRLTGSRSHRALRPQPRAKEYAAPPVASTEIETPIRDFSRKPVRVYRADPEYYVKSASYPEELAWLGKTGVLREQRYVEVHVAPIRYTSATGGLVVDSNIEVTVHFDGATVPSGRPVSEDAFEAVYSNAFVNYEQGRRFRLDNRDAVTFSAASTMGSLTDGPLRRIRVRANGLLRLDHDFFLAQAPEFLSESVADWRLTSQGVQVPLQIHQISGGGFDDALLDRPGEYVQFYGQALDLEPKSVYVSDDGGLGEQIYEARDFTDENAYFLGVATTAQPSITERDATPGGEPLAGPYFIDTRHAEVDDFFLPYGGFDLHYWLPLMTQSSPLRTEVVDLPGLYSGTFPASFRVNIKGSSQCRTLNPDKQTAAFATNGSLQQLVLPGDNPDNVGNVNIGVFDGMEGHTHEFDWVHSGADPELTDPISVSVQLFDNTETCFDPPGLVYDEALLDWIEIDYARRFEALGNELTLTWPDGPATVFEIDGFTGPVEVYEISGYLGSSDVVNAVRLTGVEVVPNGMVDLVRFRIDNDAMLPDDTPRRFVVAGESVVAAVAPIDFEPDRVSELASDDTQADLVVIVHPDVVPSFCTESAVSCGTDNDCAGGGTDVCRLDPTSALGQLLAFRASEGITSRIARVPDIEDEFNHGLPGPQAIKQFLAWVLSGGWQGEAPAYAMLVGDGTYDYKGGTTSGNYVPTQLMLKTDDLLAFYSSDNLLANVIGDDFLPDLLVGRIAVRTEAEATIVFQKILQYGSNPVAGSWQSNALVISDRANNYAIGESSDFEKMNADALAFIEDAAYTSQNLRYWSDYCTDGGPPCDKAGMRADIEAAIEGTLVPEADGAALLQFVGHGNFDLWSSDVLLCGNDDAPACAPSEIVMVDELENYGRFPLVLVHNCLSAGFHTLELQSMGEQWLKSEDAGGVAVFAPSGLGFRFIGKKVIDEVWGAIFGPTKERDLVVPVMNALVRICIENPSPEACQYHVLLGDPSLRLILPHVDPPSNPVAVSGNSEVDLSWSPSATAGATYEVYRARWSQSAQFIGVYELAGQTGDPNFIGTTFTDEAVFNAEEYVYYVVARDPDGFSSAWSNFNSNCHDDPPGDDCVAAKPLNPFPPSTPTGGFAVDPATGGALILSWNPNPETDLGHYTIHFGTTPALGQTQDHPRGEPISAMLHGLTNGTTYYFAISATNSSGVTSDLSELFTGLPTLLLGVKAPDLVRDLRIDRAGANTLLSWSAVTEDIYGDPITIGAYEVFRGVLPDFVPDEGNRLGTTPVTNFNDNGAYDEAQPNYFYLVRATDVQGNPGGVGRQLPYGIGDVRLGPSTTEGQWLMSWSPVTTDFDGEITQISHYELYVSDQPFGRAAIQQGSVELLEANITGTSIDFLPEVQNRYYSVLAVDVRGNRSPF